MKTQTEEIAIKLNMLYKKNQDAEKGFTKAAEIATAKPLSEWFTTRSLERKIFRTQIKEEIIQLGHEIDTHGNLSAGLHRTWMDIKAAFSDDNDEVMLEEAIRGEKASLIAYSEVLGEINLPRSTALLLQTHQAKIEKGLSVLRELNNIRFQEESRS